MPILCFFGPDGSGKSTLARKLAEDLMSRGFKPGIEWMRGTHTLTSILARMLAKSQSFTGSCNPYYNLCIPKNLMRLWQLLEFLSSLPIIIAKFILPSLYRVIIADRYVLDFVVWISATLNNNEYINKFEAKFLRALFSKVKVKVYVTAEVRILSKRGGGNVTFLAKQLKLYDSLASTVDVYKLDTTDKSIEDSFSELKTWLTSIGWPECAK
jgi:thymidylate kinase